MDGRTLMLYDSMKRIAHVVDAHPVLRARADESKAFEQFLAVITDLDALHAEQCSAAAALSELRARTKILMQEVLFDLDTLRTTAVLIPNGAVYFADSKWPVMKGAVFHFTGLASAIIETAARHAAVFIEHGLHPRAFDDARRTLAELIEVDHERCLLESQAASFQKRLHITVDTAKKRRNQLTSDLHRVITPEARADWERAHALGRSHRPKELSRPAEQKLLPPAEATG